MSNQTLRVEGIPFNLNEYRRHHFRKIAKEKIVWSGRVKEHLREQQIRPMTRIMQRYEFFFRDKRDHDPDNYACCAKFINDALVDCGILPGDSFDHIPHFTVCQGGISKSPYVLVHMTEVPE